MTASSPSSEVVLVSLAAQSRVASQDTTRMPRQDGVVESVQSVSTDVAAAESAACGWSNLGKEQMRGEERRPCGCRKESFAVATGVARGVMVPFPHSESPARCREDNPQSNIQAFRMHRIVFNLEYWESAKDKGCSRSRVAAVILTLEECCGLPEPSFHTGTCGPILGRLVGRIVGTPGGCPMRAPGACQCVSHGHAISAELFMRTFDPGGQ